MGDEQALATLHPEQVGVPILGQCGPVFGYRLAQELAKLCGAADEHPVKLSAWARPGPDNPTSPQFPHALEGHRDVLHRSLTLTRAAVGEYLYGSAAARGGVSRQLMRSA